MRTLIAATALSSFALAASPAFAADAATPAAQTPPAAQNTGDSSGIGEIIVTAQKTNQWTDPPTCGRRVLSTERVFVHPRALSLPNPAAFLQCTAPSRALRGA